MTIPPPEQFGNAEDGTPLHWNVFVPATTPAPGVLVVHGGGFRKPSEAPAMLYQTCADLQAAGYVAYANEYRLAPPGLLIGQVDTGRYPQQVHDITLAVLTARGDSRCNGKLGGIGGSAGGTHVANACGIGTVGSDRLDCGIDLSGAHDFSDRTPDINLGSFVKQVRNYCDTKNLTELYSDSTVALIDNLIAPLFLANATEDTMPVSQQIDLVAKLDELGVTNYSARTLAGRYHAFSLWPLVKTDALAFLNENLT